MKTHFNIKGFLTVIGTLFLSVISFSQDAAEAVSAAPVAQEIPMYEKFGLTSTELFILMVSFTILLVIVVVSISSSTSKIADYTAKNKSKINGKGLLLILGLMVAPSAFSAEPLERPTFEIPFTDTAFWIVLSFDIILIMIILYMVGIMNGLLYAIYPKKPRKSIWKRWQKSLVDATPIESEASILMDHDYDGIKELDNNLPPWWKYGFYVTIVWAVGYLAYYHLLGGVLQEEEYLIEMAEGEAAVAQYKLDHPELVTADNVEQLTDAQSISKGRSIFTEFCVTCHMEGGAGGAGPNLTDNYWIYGGDIKGVFKTISEGADNGMKAWNTQLNGLEIQAVASYVMQLDPILPPLGQEPKGDNFIEKIIE